MNHLHHPIFLTYKLSRQEIRVATYSYYVAGCEIAKGYQLPGKYAYSFLLTLQQNIMKQILEII